MLNKMKIKMKKARDENVLVVNKLNYDLLKRITSHSYYSFHELYYVHSNKYWTCLQIFDLPEESKSNFFGFLMDIPDVFVTVDVDHMTKVEFVNSFEKIIRKNNDEAESTKKYRTAKNKIEEIRSIRAFDHYLDETNQEVKQMTVRVYISAISLEELQKKIDDVITLLISKKMRGYIQTNDLESDVVALTDVSNTVKRMVASETIADIVFRSEISRVDNHGSLIGYTASGVYCPDLFSFRNYSYNYILMGGMGAGKSALLKALEEGYYCMGNHVMHLFDIHGEYKEYARKLGIPVVSIDDSNTVNLCQMFYTFDENGIITQMDITNRIAVIVETFKTAAMENRKNVLDHFENELNDFYNVHVLDKNIHELSNGDWFTLGDILTEIENKTKNGFYSEEARNDIYELRLSFGNMLNKYGYIYDRKTNMDFDLTKSLVFDISYFDKAQDKKIKSAYVSMLADYVGMAVRLHLERNNALMKEMGVKPHELKRPPVTYRLVVDETLDYAEDTGFLLKMINLLKYMRKAYAGAAFVVHTYDETKRKVQAGADEESYLGQIFSLCTNKFVGMTDGATLNELPLIVKSMNDRDVQIVSTFKKGVHGERRFLIIDDQKQKYYITSIVNSFQKEYFGGGA